MDSPETAVRILLVDDSRTQAMMLRQVLTRLGYAVTVAHSGEEALATISAARPAVVVSDILMPGIDGYELCRQLQALPEHMHTPIILMTSMSEPAEAIKALAAGAANFLVKPVSAETLHARIEQTLATQASDIHPDAVEVSFAGTRHHLPADARRMVGFLVSTFEDAVAKNGELEAKNSELRGALRTISQLESRYRGLIETSMEALLVLNTEGLTLFANSAAEQLFERSAEAMENEAAPFPLGDSTEVAIERSDGTIAHAEFRLTETLWAGKHALLATFWDVTENVMLREQLRNLSLTDELTGLNNLRGFLTLAHQQLLIARRRGSDSVLLFADMDGLKAINDTWGHADGDRALAEIATMLHTLLRGSDIVARVGGDEFAALLCDTNPENAELVVGRINALFVDRNERRTTPWSLNISVGTVEIPPEATQTLEDLLAEADRRMYTVKTQKRAERR